MKRRDFFRNNLLLGAGAVALSGESWVRGNAQTGEYHQEDAQKLPIRKFDVVVAGGGTAGVFAALAAARQGAKTMLIERKGYTGGTAVEGGTAIHSFYNLWTAFPGVEKRKVVRGLPEELIDRLTKIGGATGYPEMTGNIGYDSVCTNIDTEMYKMLSMEMLDEAGVFMAVNTLLAGAIVENGRLKGVITESRNGREAIYAKSFIDSTAYGDLAAFAGAKYTEPNDYPVVNSVGIGNVDVEAYHRFFKENNALGDYCEGPRSGKEGQIIRLGGNIGKASPEFGKEARKIGMSAVTTTVHDNYFMFIKLNMKMAESPTNRDEVAKVELELRKRMYKAVELFKKYVPGCENAFMARTSPSLCIRRGRLIECDYDMTHEDVIEARHFDDEVFVYGFHDSAPRLQIKNGGTYGLRYKAMIPKGIENLFTIGMMITSDHRAHMSTRNTVSCMGMGQASGTAAALCAEQNCNSRDLKYSDLRKQLKRGGVYFEA